MQGSHRSMDIICNKRNELLIAYALP